MFEQPFPKSFSPNRSAGVAGMNRIRLAGDWPDNGVRIEDQARFGSLLDDFDDPRVFAPKRRSNPHAGGIPDDLHEPSDCVSAGPRIGQGDFVGAQSNNDEVRVVITDKARKFAVPSRRVCRLCAAHFVKRAN